MSHSKEVKIIAWLHEMKIKNDIVHAGQADVVALAAADGLVGAWMV